jgi:hypothetical protein
MLGSGTFPARHLVQRLKRLDCHLIQATQIDIS